MHDLDILFGDDASMRARPKLFKSGARGYGAYGKIELEGKRFQVSCNIVEVGSKPQTGSVVATSGDE